MDRNKSQQGRLYVFCERGSSSAATLCRALRERGIRARRLRKCLAGLDPSTPIINWGSSSGVPDNALNGESAVRAAISKIETARILAAAGVPTVKVTTNVEEARSWLLKKRRVLGRLDGLSGGKGITEVTQITALDGDRFDFFSRYFPKTHELRVHVIGGKCVDLIEKRARMDYSADRTLRSWENGWVFAHQTSLTEASDVDRIHTLALEAVKALGLDFGAVDILVTLLGPGTPTRRLITAVVCEVNTAPGLVSPTTINAYADGFKSLLFTER